MTEKEIFIALVDNDCLTSSDAIVLLEGDGLNRYEKAVGLFKANWGKKIIFSGGIVDYKYGSYPYEDVIPHILNAGIDKEYVIHESKSKNTKEQAVEVIRLAEKNNWKKLILVATHDHQYRAYLTFLKEVLIVNKNIILYNAPVRNLKWFEETGWGSRIVRLEKEFDRIEKYFNEGHLASFKEAIKYQEWKEIQP